VPQSPHRGFLREKEASQLVSNFAEKLKLDITQLFDSDKPRIETAEVDTIKIYYVGGRPVIASFKDTLFPTLLFEKALMLMPRITVNMGAVPYICNGADLMAPGIVKIEGNFTADDYVVVDDERHHKPLAIVAALADSEAVRNLKHGKVAKNLHYVGDGLWKELRKS